MSRHLCFYNASAPRKSDLLPKEKSSVPKRPKHLPIMGRMRLINAYSNGLNRTNQSGQSEKFIFTGGDGGGLRILLYLCRLFEFWEYMKLSRKALIGYPAGIVTGVTYGLNPLFAMPLLMAGAEVQSVLFFRYGLAVILLGAYMLMRRQSFKVNARQAGVLFVLGLLFTASSLLLFESYRFIASGLATTLVFLYPVLVALIMVFMGKIPSWPVWLSIAATFAGVVIMTGGGGNGSVNPAGIVLSVCSAFTYALFIVIINRSKIISGISNNLLTFYALTVGAVVFFGIAACSGTPLTANLSGIRAWLNLIGLAVLPTIVSTATLAVATRNIGATKASVLGVFEPITAILVGTIAFGEPLTPAIIIGIAISVIAVTFMIYSTKR